ncbi:MAG: AAA family ATPase [Bacteroidales bacterium]|nr:AAA family ATPase [Bacteroidales bacterium]
MPSTDSILDDFLKGFGYGPTPCQMRFFEAVSEFAGDDGCDILIVNGYAGTGKTSAVAAVVGALAARKVKTVLLAPTGRSAKVLSGMCSRPAFTVHKHIYRQQGVADNGMGRFGLSPNKLGGAWFFVDEASLLGAGGLSRDDTAAEFGSGNLLADLITFVRSGDRCRLVLIGDNAQLPPVGLDVSPALYPEWMEATFGGVRQVELTTVVRQALESGILLNATAIRERIAVMSPDEAVADLRLDLSRDDVTRVGGEDLIETLTDAYARYGDDGVVVLTRSNKRAIRYNLGIRSTVQFKEERLVRGDKLMIVKNCYQFLENVQGLDYIANGDIAVLRKISRYEERYGLHFADAVLEFPDYGDVEVKAKVCLDTLESESASLTREQQEALYLGVSADYSHITRKKDRYEAVREDKYYNALQLKYADAVTCHKSQGGQWKCVFIDCPFWLGEQTVDDLKWLYTALTRAQEKVCLVNFPDRFFR